MSHISGSAHRAPGSAAETLPGSTSAFHQLWDRNLGDAVVTQRQNERPTSSYRPIRVHQEKEFLCDTLKTGRRSRRSGAEYAYAAITPADVHCLPLLTSLAPAHPAYPPYWLLLPGLIHRTRPVIPLCADVSLFTPTFGAQWANTAKCSTTSAVIVIKKMCLAGAAECQAPPATKTCTYVTACQRTYHVTVDLISQDGNAVFGGH